MPIVCRASCWGINITTESENEQQSCSHTLPCSKGSGEKLGQLWHSGTYVCVGISRLCMLWSQSWQLTCSAKSEEDLHSTPPKIKWLSAIECKNGLLKSLHKAQESCQTLFRMGRSNYSWCHELRGYCIWLCNLHFLREELKPTWSMHGNLPIVGQLPLAAVSGDQHHPEGLTWTWTWQSYKSPNRIKWTTILYIKFLLDESWGSKRFGIHGFIGFSPMKFHVFLHEKNPWNINVSRVRIWTGTVYFIGLS